jgi:broad specificity phosphatase PhoE
MAHLHLVRHGHAAASYGDDHDPGLDDEGRRQAEAVAERLAPIGPLPILTSPLRRCRETAAPLAARWGTTPAVEPAITEVAAPSDDLRTRSEWLQRALAGRWSDLEAAPRRWREALVDRLLTLDTDAVLFTHFVAVNAVIGWATGDDRVMIDPVGYCSVTVVEPRDGTLHLVEAGSHGHSEVL